MFLIPKDIREAAIIDRRRRIEEERKSRIFNVKQRTIGVDEKFLKKQILERKVKEDEQNKIDESFERQRIHDAQIAIIQEKKQNDEKRRIDQEISVFRSEYQKLESRREYDLNDPDHLKKSLPARVSDDDPRCTISSAQKFIGEDVNTKLKRKEQAVQYKAWLDQQMTERKAKEREIKAAERAYQESLAALDKRAIEIEKMEQECRKLLSESALKFNKALSEENLSRRRLSKMREEEDNRAEIYTFITGSFLAENSDANIGYRGMSPDELNTIRRKQLEQIEEKKKKYMNEVQLKNKWNTYLNSLAHQTILEERGYVRRQRELNKQIVQQNKALEQEQKSRRDYINKVLMTNIPSPEYYDWFNRSTR